MNELRAFVGHSFTDDDKDVVRAILEYLGQIEKMNIGFNWEHAEPAEPKELAEKVMKLMEDKNLFIGICTKKERVIAQDKLLAKLFFPGQLSAKIGDFAWKTSDWLIQEIGLAVGRKMAVILLVEQDLRRPGGLQGNLEFIQFSRQSPEKSFGRLLEMIRAILPEAKLIQETTAKQPETGEEEEPQKDEYDWAEPKPEWTRRHYDFALMHMVATENNEGETKIYEAYLQTEDGKQIHKMDSWVAAKEYFHIVFAEDGSLANLESHARNKITNSDVQDYLARAYQNFDEGLKAAKSYILAVENEPDEKRKLAFLGKAGCAYAKAKKGNELTKVIDDSKKLASRMDGGERLLLDNLGRISEIQEDKVFYLAYTERLLDLQPDDVKARFQLAYGHSEQDHDALALFHYLKIPPRSRDSATWNNIGVANSVLGLYGKAVENYLIAEEKESTLAMNNIARKYLEAGFLSESEQQCNKAKKSEDYHKNIDSTLFQLKGKREEEQNKQTRILDESKLAHDFYVNFGRAAAKGGAPHIVGDWSTKKCNLKLELKDGKLKAHGTYEESGLGLASLFMPKTEAVKPRRYEVLYEGEVTGYAIRGTLRKNEEGKRVRSSSLLTSDETTKDVLMILSDDLDSINVYQKDASHEHEKFHEVEKIRPGGEAGAGAPA